MTNSRMIGSHSLPTGASADVLIVGAGAAGLALSRHLTAQGRSHLIVDREGVAASWRAMPTALRLVSPWWTNALELRDLLRHWPFAMVAADAYAAYLRTFASRHRIDVIQGCEVTRIHRKPTDGGFAVETSLGTIQAGAVVLASGYFQTPAAPSPPYADDRSVPVIHAAGYRDAASTRAIAGDKPVVVLGKRISAGQIMVELATAGTEVILSCRPPVEFRRDGMVGSLKDFLYYFYEELLLYLRPELQVPSFPVMDGGLARKLVERGSVKVAPPIRQIADGRVEFEDGSEVEAGLVIHATGYHAVVSGLDLLVRSRDADGLPSCHNWESVDCPGLFFLGLDNRMNYRSRTLRGIRRDAARLAKLLGRRQDSNA